MRTSAKAEAGRSLRPSAVNISGLDEHVFGLVTECSLAQLVVQLGCGEEVARSWARQLARQGSGVVVAVDHALSPWQAAASGDRQSELSRRPAAASSDDPYIIRVFRSRGEAVRQALYALGVQAAVLHVCTPPPRSTARRSGLRLYMGDLVNAWADLLVPGGVLLAPKDQEGVAALALTELGLELGGLVPEERGGHWLLRTRAAEPWPPGWQPRDLVSAPYEGTNMSMKFDAEKKEVECRFSWEAAQWGNLVGPYFQCLSVAQLLGWTFRYASAFHEDWMARLPRTVAPGLVKVDPAEVKRAMDVCSNDLWCFPHDCLYGWRAAKPAIQNVLRTTFFTWLRDTGKEPHAFAPTDALIQVRCSSDTLLWHSSYGPAAFSFYVRNLPAYVRRVYALHAQHGFMSPAYFEPCERIVKALGEYITAHRPDVKFEIVGGERWEDFARLILAPVLFIEGGSSWGLWAALANTGRVFHPPFLAPVWDGRGEAGGFLKPRVHPRFVVADANVLYPDVGHQQGLNAEDVDGIIRWLERN
ncbi:hypothetical protein HYH03_001312 [Edaphochlamys debaryana]|uniref:Uncharacterized protein n=1 Tax=Edaphochlamys debaryana TaxID=47281 RepID=A0A835YCU2_9CHLO|nr:hypothetical protein HYH03_001312 [Edaphochlamys debaryana]|eukprot:KAG2500535.1 hypothetical protein HYH03_001312 [Edaphochlamys debaryana]